MALLGFTLPPDSGEKLSLGKYKFFALVFVLHVTKVMNKQVIFTFEKKKKKINNKSIDIQKGWEEHFPFKKKFFKYAKWKSN